MENNNNSKQVVLSIVGIAILVIAVVGVSFAFFTYSRTGEKNNIITTGSITFELADGEQPTLEGENSFPITDNADIANAPHADFDVTGSLPSGASPVTYKVYAIKGVAPTDPEHPQGDSSRTWAPFEDSEISLGLSVTGTTSVSIVEGYEYAANTSEDSDNGKYGSPIDNIEKDETHNADHPKGLLLATGTLGAGENIDDKFTIKMWVNKSVTISDTDRSKTYRASDTKKGDSPLPYDETGGADNSKNLLQEDEGTDPREVYSDHYYAIKILVVASDDPNYFNGN